MGGPFTEASPARESIVAVVLFWLSVFAVAYAYGGYLLVLVAIDAGKTLSRVHRAIGGGSPLRETSPRPRPKVSVLIAAHNEAEVIAAKLENTLALDHPPDLLEILVGSDGSTDGTDAIVSSYVSRGVRLSAAPRAGKVGVLNRLARQASGSVFLFTDANTMLAPDALGRLLAGLDDPEVGAVCGRLQLVSSEGSAAEGLYWRYECLLKEYESRCGSVMGANGGLYLLRADEWRELPSDTIVDDLLVTMRVVQRGRMVKYAPDAVAQEESGDTATEFRRRVRIATGNFRALHELWPILVHGGFSSFAFWSHKVLRWCVPACLATAFIASALLVGRPFYAAAFVMQLGGLAIAWGLPRSRAGRLVGHFLAMNVALFVGFVRSMRGGRPAIWERTVRAGEPRAA